MSSGDRTVRNLYPPANDAEREAVLRFAHEAPLVYGPWRHLKWLYKRAEEAGDRELLGALIGRLDAAALPDRWTPAPPSGIDRVYRVALGETVACLIRGDQYYERSLDIVDLSEPLQPVTLHTQKLSQAQDVEMTGNLAVVLSTRYLRLFDLSHPAHPHQAGRINFDRAACFAVSGRYAYVGHQGGYGSASHLHVVDLANPANPERVGLVEVASPALVAVSGTLALVVSEWDYRRSRCVFQVVDVSVPTRPRLAGRLELPRNILIGGIAVEGTRAFLTANRGYYNASAREVGLITVDISRPDRPDIRSRVTIEQAKDVAVHNGIACVTSGYGGSGEMARGGLHVLDAGHPSGPQLIGSVPLSYPADVAVRGHQVFVLTARSNEYVGGILRVVDLSELARPALLGDRPSVRTLGYMKRRARRFLAELAVRDPDSAVEAAFLALSAPDQRREALDPRSQWVAYDLLYGGTGRYEQIGHGRGTYRLRTPRFVLKTREERMPSAWDRRPDLARQLLADAGLPWQTHEAALKMLRAARQPLPDFSDEALARFLRSPAPLLVTTAARQAAARLDAGQALNAETAADAFFLSSAARRRRIREAALQLSRKEAWRKAFAGRLFAHSSAIDDGRGARRKGAALALLAADFPGAVEPEAMRPLLGVLFAANRADLRNWVFETVRRLPSFAVPGWLESLSMLPEEHREMAYRVLREAVREQAFDFGTARAMVHSALPWVRVRGWELLVESSTRDEDIARLWDELLDIEDDTTALETAFESLHALALLNRVRIGAERFMERLEARPILVRLLTPAAFASVVGAIPPDGALRLIAAAPDEQWQALRQACVAGLREAGRLAAFWQAAARALPADASGVLRQRLLDDPDVAVTFLEADDPGLLSITDPAFDPLLARWARRHAGLFPRGAETLLEAATHALPELRGWALEHVREVGLDLPFALRLMESDLPPAAACGQEFFEAAPPGDPREAEYALALCDSPRPSVRAYGRDYAARRWDHLPVEEVAARLAESTDPLMQEFVAARLPAGSPAAPAFDRQVLRARDRGRRAKEAVKRRRDAAPPADGPTAADVPMLLEMARSRTPRDAEWALAQLARLALQGVAIEGLAVEGEATV